MAIELHLKKNLGSFQLDINIESESRRIGILGASGCGKSMTLRSIAGVERPDSGRIIVDGRTMYDSSRKINLKPQQRNIGYLFQNYALFPTMTVEENIAAGLKCDKAAKRERVAQMVEKFQVSGLEKQLPGQLSGGQQQRVALARIMAYEPDAILLDEPFSALDANLKDRLQQELMELLSDYKGTVILVSHSRDEIYRFSQELIVMDRGRGICQGETQELFDDPRYIKAAALTGCKNIAPMEIQDKHHFRIPDWGVSMEIVGEIPQGVTHVGIRAHDFIPIWESEPGLSAGNSQEDNLSPGQAQKGEPPINCMGVQVKSTARLPFENKYFLGGTSQEVEEVCWFVQRELQQELEEKGLPDWLKLPEEKLLFLK